MRHPNHIPDSCAKCGSVPFIGPVWDYDPPDHTGPPQVLQTYTVVDAEGETLRTVLLCSHQEPIVSNCVTCYCEDNSMRRATKFENFRQLTMTS